MIDRRKYKIYCTDQCTYYKAGTTYQPKFGELSNGKDGIKREERS